MLQTQPEHLRDDALLSVRDLRVLFRRGQRTMEAVAGVSFDVRRGETVGLVGESGSGKTTTGRAILQLLPKANSSMAGTVTFNGEDLQAMIARLYATPKDVLDEAKQAMVAK